MTDFLPCRGHVYIVKASGGGSSGFELQPSLTGNEDSPIILQSLTVDDRVVNLPVLTLDGVRILYVFGKAWGDIGVGGLAVLGKGGTGAALAEVVNWFRTNSVEKSESAASVSLPGNVAYKFYATALSIGEPDAEHQFFPFSVYGKIIE